MPLYRRKPTTVEAHQFFGHPSPGVTQITHGDDTEGCVTTIQGRSILVKLGEWIVKESDGIHYYPIADAEFKRIYEPVEK